MCAYLAGARRRSEMPSHPLCRLQPCKSRVPPKGDHEDDGAVGRVRALGEHLLVDLGVGGHHVEPEAVGRLGDDLVGALEDAERAGGKLGVAVLILVVCGILSLLGLGGLAIVRLLA